MKAGCFVVVAPRYNSLGQVKGFRVDRLTQGYPQSLHNGEQAFHLEVNMPESAFRPLSDVVITVPEQDLVEPEVRVGG